MCLKSFNIVISNSYTFIAPEVKTWVTNGNQNFGFISDGLQSTFDIEGFQKIDLYGVQVNGIVAGNKSASIGQVIVQDWNFKLFVVGSESVVSGKVLTGSNFWNLNYNNTSSRNLFLGKYKSEINFLSPIMGVSQIVFDGLEANGYNALTANTASLNYNLTFTFYYKYEGE
jgi:hypothetical protein